MNGTSQLRSPQQAYLYYFPSSRGFRQGKIVNEPIRDSATGPVRNHVLSVLSLSVFLTGSKANSRRPTPRDKPRAQPSGSPAASRSRRGLPQTPITRTEQRAKPSTPAPLTPSRRTMFSGCIGRGAPWLRLLQKLTWSRPPSPPKPSAATWAARACARRWRDKWRWRWRRAERRSAFRPRRARHKDAPGWAPR